MLRPKKRVLRKGNKLVNSFNAPQSHPKPRQGQRSGRTKIVEPRANVSVLEAVQRLNGIVDLALRTWAESSRLRDNLLKHWLYR